MSPKPTVPPLKTVDVIAVALALERPEEPLAEVEFNPSKVVVSEADVEGASGIVVVTSTGDGNIDVPVSLNNP